MKQPWHLAYYLAHSGGSRMLAVIVIPLMLQKQTKVQIGQVIHRGFHSIRTQTMIC